MKAKLILGRAGSGKTYYCLESIRTALKESPWGRPLILLTPEQATFQMDRALLSDPDIPGYCRAQVVSFRRLAYLVFQEVGGPVLPPAGNIARHMLLSRLLAQNRAKLTVFAGATNRPGLVRRIADTITEFHQYRVTEENLQSQLDLLKRTRREESLLALKLHDLLLIYRAYHEAMANRYADPDDFLDILCERIPLSHVLRDAHVWVDGFAGFTPQQYAVLEALMKVCEEMEIALCLDPRRIKTLPQEPDALDPTSFFHPVEETCLLLQLILAKLQVTPQILGMNTAKRFQKNRGIAHIEKTLFRSRAESLQSAPGDVKLIAAANERVETECVAREILRLCKEREYRFRDIAVILRSGQPYYHLIEATFEEYGIPYFVDRRREVTYHPLVQLIRAAVACVVSNWSQEHVIDYMKSGLLSLAQEKLDVIENYALEHGIDHSSWYVDEPWSYRRSEDLERDVPPEGLSDSQLSDLNECRKRIVLPLKKFHRTINSGRPQSVREYCTAVCALLVDLKAENAIETWRRQAEEKADLDAADEHAHIWNGIMSLFEELVQLMGDEQVAVEEFAELLETSFETMTLGFVPPSVDQVLVATIERSRHPEIRAAFVMGMSEEQFPLVRAEDPILNDSDRRVVAEHGLKLGSTREQHLYHERFLAYIAFTRPSEYLWVSYPVADAAGKKRNESIFLAELKRCLRDFRVEHISSDESERPLSAIWNTSQLAAAAALSFRSLPSKARSASTLAQTDDLAGLYNCCIARDDAKDQKAKKILSSLFYSNKARPLPSGLLRKLFAGKRIVGSVSQFETFAACPFKYFARHVLKLNPREEHVISALDLGTLYHAVLKRVMDRIIQLGSSWEKVENPQVDALVDHAVDELSPRLKGEILLSDGRSHFIRQDAAETLQRMLHALIEQMRATEFRPVECELDFGRGDGKLPPYTFSLKNGYRADIVGRIDRVDIAPSARKVFVKVVDYKSGNVSPVLPLIANGLHFQLPTYLLVLMKHSRKLLKAPVAPAGAFLAPIRAGISNVPLPPSRQQPDQEPEDLTPGYRNRGFFAAHCLKLLDTELHSGRSRHFFVHIKTNGDLGHMDRTDVLPDDLISRLLERTKELLHEVAANIAKGTIAVKPYRMGTSSPCTNCEYAEVCRFDATRQPARKIQKSRIKDVLQELGWKASNDA